MHNNFVFVHSTDLTFDGHQNKQQLHSCLCVLAKLYLWFLCCQTRFTVCMEEYHRAPVHNMWVSVSRKSITMHLVLFHAQRSSHGGSWGWPIAIGMMMIKVGVDVKSLNGGRLILVVADLSIHIGDYTVLPNLVYLFIRAMASEKANTSIDLSTIDKSPIVDPTSRLLASLCVSPVRLALLLLQLRHSLDLNVGDTLGREMRLYVLQGTVLGLRQQEVEEQKSNDTHSCE